MKPTKPLKSHISVVIKVHRKRPHRLLGIPPKIKYELNTKSEKFAIPRQQALKPVSAHMQQDGKLHKILNWNEAFTQLLVAAAAVAKQGLSFNPKTHILSISQVFGVSIYLHLSCLCINMYCSAKGSPSNMLDLVKKWLQTQILLDPW